MNVIFLDIDGVLNSLRSHTATKGTEVALGTKNYNAEVTRTAIDPIAVKLINKLVEETDAKIVVSSSHRTMFIQKYGFGEIEVLDLVGLRDYIHHQGIEAEIIGATDNWYFPRRHEGAIRGDEIQLYLNAHPEITNYLIIDDDADMLEKQLPHFVHTSTLNGFQYEHYSKAREIFKLEPLDDSVNRLCRTDQEYCTQAAYAEGQHVRWSHNGTRGFGLVKGLAFFAEHMQIYIIEDTSGVFPNKDYPFSSFPVPYSSLSITKD